MAQSRLRVLARVMLRADFDRLRGFEQTDDVLQGALVRLLRTLETVAEVLRLERNPVQPLAALQLLGETDEWRGLVWEPRAASHLLEPLRE